jgi:anthranilate synthase component 1
MAAPTVETTRAAFRRAADAEGARVPCEVRVPVADPFEAYRRARGDAPAFYFETGGGTDGWGYFGVDPASFVEADTGALDALADACEGERLARGDCAVPYPGGVFGWLSYDAAREIETLPETACDDRSLPRLQAGVYPRVAAWREPFESGDDLRVVAAPRVTDPDTDYDAARAAALELADSALNGDPGVGSPPVDAASARFESDCGRAAFADRVRRVKEYIRDGDTFQANVSQRLVAPAAVHPVAAYAALRRVNPAPYAGLVEFPGVDLVSASPELLVERVDDRLLTEPIAGTRPRGDTPAEDERLEADLRSDEKERAEHAMLVDLERNDVGKVCRYGSVAVDEYRRVDRYSEVMHLVSRVGGRLRADVNLADIVAAVFPGGTITGAPKPRTMEIIEAVEATRRGPYTGSMFAVGFDGRATLNIVIRTLVRHAGEYHLRVGAGVVHDSDPDSEYEETLAKGRALVNAVDAALGDRAAMEVDP